MSRARLADVWNRLGRRQRTALLWLAVGLGLALAWALPGLAEAGSAEAAAWSVALATSLRLMAVGGLAYLGLEALRRRLPVAGARPGARLQLVETRKLGPRQALHLVEVEGQRLLVGATEQHLTLLAAWNQEEATGEHSDFAPLLAQALPTNGRPQKGVGL